MMRTTELLGCSYPVVLGAMGVICNPELVAAVSEAGGFGLLATAFASDAAAFRRQVKATKALTDKPFGANLQVMNPMSEALAEVLADEGIDVVTISGGSPKAIFPFLKARGMKVIPVVPTVDVACKAEALGADAIVAEGSESGGIQGFRGASTMVLVPAMVDAVKVPVIAAGGISDSRGYRAALALGADGVQVGTRFIATTECIAHENYKKVIIDLPEIGTGLVDMGHFRIRALKTPLVEGILSGKTPGGGGFSGAGLEESWIEGDLEAGVLPAGEGIGLVKKILPVREIIEEMVK
jgi:enoyl-[acyl-carrier protein] reductase II